MTNPTDAMRAESRAPDPEKTCAGVGEFPYLLHGEPTCPTCREHIRAVYGCQITQEQHFPPDPEPTP